jgi:hypothetical protein
MRRGWCAMARYIRPAEAKSNDLSLSSLTIFP